MVDIHWHEGCIFVGHACSSTLLLGRSKPLLLLQTSSEIWDLRCDFWSHARYKKQNELRQTCEVEDPILGLAQRWQQSRGIFFKTFDSFCQVSVTCNAFVFSNIWLQSSAMLEALVVFCIFWNLCHFGGYNVNQKAPSRRTAIRRHPFGWIFGCGAFDIQQVIQTGA